MSREFDIPVVKIHQKWGCDNNPTAMPCFNYRHMLRSQSTFQKPKLKKRFFPHNIASWRFDHDIASWLKLR